MSATLCSYCKVYPVSTLPHMSFCSIRCRDLSHSKNCGDPLLWREGDYCPRCLSNEPPFVRAMILNVQKDTIYCPRCRWQSKDIDYAFESCKVGATCLECNQGKLYLDLNIYPAILRCGNCLICFSTAPLTPKKEICSNVSCENFDESAEKMKPPQTCNNCKTDAFKEAKENYDAGFVKAVKEAQSKNACITPNCFNKRTAGSEFCSIECQQVCLKLCKKCGGPLGIWGSLRVCHTCLFGEEEVNAVEQYPSISPNLKRFVQPDKVSLEAFLKNGHFTQRSLLDAQAHICDVANCIMEAKNSDYANEVVSVFQNFLVSEQMSGVELVRGIFQRICDKMSRLRTFLDRGTLSVKEEGLDNIVVDVINYLCIILCYQFEKKNATLQATEPGVTATGVPGTTEQGSPDGSELYHKGISRGIGD